MARRDDDHGQPQEEVDDAEGSETEDESEGAKGKVIVKNKGKSRRKASEKPEGSDQKRQAFSKRKRGLILKSYQLYKLTDARVFVFVVNDKGSSWAYASPGFAKTLSNQHLLQMREYAQLSGNQRLSTEIMPHPHTDAEDRRIDDRPHVIRANLGSPESTGPGPGGTPTPPSGIARNPSSSAISQQQQQQMLDMPPPPGSSAPGQMPPPGSGTTNMGIAAARRAAAQDLDDAMEDDVMRDAAPAGPHVSGGRSAYLSIGPDSIITPSGNRMAAAVGIFLPPEAGGDGFRDDMDRDMPPPGPRGAGGGGGRPMGHGDRGGGFGGVMPGLQPDVKQARSRDGGYEGGPQGPAMTSGGRGRRLDLPPPGATQQQQQQPRRGSGPGSGAGDPGPHPQSAGPRGGQLGSLQQQDLPGSFAEEDQRQLQRGGGGGNRPQQLSQPPAPSQQQQPQQPAPSQQQRPPPGSHGSGPPSFATGYVLPGAFSYGQVVQGSDGQLYRVVRELDDGEAPVMDDVMTVLEEGTARVLTMMPQGGHPQALALHGGPGGGGGAGGGGGMGRMAYGHGGR